MGFLGKLITIIFGVYVIAITVLFFTQESIIFHPPTLKREITNIDGVNPDGDVFLQTLATGEEISGYFVPQPHTQKTIMFFHGNAGDISDNAGRIAMAESMDYQIVLFDYRGYGFSTGRIRQESDLYEDSEAIYEYLMEKGIPRKDIVFWGQSLGGAVAIEMAVRHPEASLVIESSFIDLPSIAPSWLKKIAPNFLWKYTFNSQKKLSQYTGNTLVIHSPEDEVIPFSMGKLLFDTANKPKKFLETEGTHNSFLQYFSAYQSAIETFLRYQY